MLRKVVKAQLSKLLLPTQGNDRLKFIHGQFKHHAHQLNLFLKGNRFAIILVESQEPTTVQPPKLND